MGVPVEHIDANGSLTSHGAVMERLHDARMSLGVAANGRSPGAGLVLPICLAPAAITSPQLSVEGHAQLERRRQEDCACDRSGRWLRGASAPTVGADDGASTRASARQRAWR
jgi:hypothetical protein